MKFPTFRISTLGLFLIILLALFLSIVLSKSIKNMLIWREGLINYNLDTASLSQSALPKYSSNKIYKLHNNLYFDYRNGNLVDVAGLYTPSGSTMTASGEDSLTQFQVRKRDGTTSSGYDYKTVTAGVAESKVTNMVTSSSTPYFEFTSTGDGSETKRVFYITWGTDTYIHLMTTSPDAKQTATFYVSGDKSHNASYAKNTSIDEDAELKTVFNSTSAYSPTGQENKFATDTNQLYNQSTQLFCLCDDVFYDPTVGNLIVLTRDDAKAVATMKIYKRSIITPASIVVNPAASNIVNVGAASPFVDSATSLPSVNGMGSMVVYTPKYMVVYIANGNRTVVFFAYNNTGNASSNLHVQNVARFDIDGTFVTGTENGSTAPTASSSSSSVATASVANDDHAKAESKESTEPKNIDDYMNRFFSYMYLGGGADGGKMSMSDFMLKSQVVPPVCPKCPGCPSSGVCTTCGGQGGAGTVGAGTVGAGTGGAGTGGAGTGGAGTGGAGTGGAGQLNTVGTGPISTAVAGTANVASNAITSTADLAKTAITDATIGTIGLAAGAASLGKSAVTGTVDLAKDAASGTVGLAKDTVSGTVELARDAVGGVANLFSRNPYDIHSVSGITSTQYPYTAGNIDGTGGQTNYFGRTMPTTQGNDPYSLYGALPNRGGGSNYIPVTADFSAFGR